MKEQTLWIWLSELHRQHQLLIEAEGRLFQVMGANRRQAIQARKEAIEAETDLILDRIEREC